MVRQRSEFLFAAFIGVAWFAVGCGGDGSIYSETVAAKVTSVEVSPSSLAVNQQTTLLVGFDAATYTPGDFDQTDDDSPSAQSVAFDLVIRLARGLDYVVNSSTLTDSLTGDVIFGNSDPRGPNSVGLCEDGSRFLLYRFGDDELSADSPLSKELRLQVQAYEPAPSSNVLAAASFSITQPCFEPAESSATVSID